MKRLRVAALLAVALGALPTAGHAITTCAAVALPVAFASFNPISLSATDGTGQVSVVCTFVGLGTDNVGYNIRLSTGAAGSYAPRTMVFLASALQYNLYTNASRTIVWGDGSGGSSTVSDSYTTGVGVTTRNYPVYGRISPVQAVQAGAYADLIIVTVDY